MKTKVIKFAAAMIGLLMMAAGVYFYFGETFADLPEIARKLFCVISGFGCALFGHNLSGMMFRQSVYGSSSVQGELETEAAYESNLEIVERAKGKAFDAMDFVLFAFLVSCFMMRADIFVELLIVAAALIMHGVFFYYRRKYEKETRAETDSKR